MLFRADFGNTPCVVYRPRNRAQHKRDVIYLMLNKRAPRQKLSVNYHNLFINYHFAHSLVVFVIDFYPFILCLRVLVLFGPAHHKAKRFLFAKRNMKYEHNEIVMNIEVFPCIKLILQNEIHRYEANVVLTRPITAS